MVDLILNEEEPSEGFENLEALINALESCWKLGQTYKFSIMRPKPVKYDGFG